jgi:ceramide glucosyltransferase
MNWASWAVDGAGLVAGAYQTVAIAACWHRLRQPPRQFTFTPPVSILKPIRGADPRFWEAIRSHAELDYPEFEILFGVRDPQDPALPHIERLMAEYPRRSIRLIHTSTSAPNAKAGVLAELAREARHDVLLVNDSDIRVPPGYLQQCCGPLEEARIGLVTCLYRADAGTFAGRFEALGIDTDFAPSTLVAPFVGVREFALGSTLCFRRADLERVGGFEAIGSFLADDYQLGKRIHALGLDCHLAAPVVETQLGARTMRDAWAHQVRWARTIRVSRGDGYAGLPVTFATLWGLVALAAGHWWTGTVVLLLRLVMVLVSGLAVMRSPGVARRWWWFPARDLWAVAVWVTGLFGRQVEWRGLRLRLDSEGRIVG